jgi:hypothetical protein
MVLVHAADGESQHKLKSVCNALDATPVVASRFKKDHHYPMVTRLVCCLSERSDEVLVQFGYDVNTFPAM